ncbi:TetR family transcriptional regulator [Glutamicibacter protophormiae]|uniref:TetR/AcrR family transcriptional regulator n=1 Tax=Kocuria TaxID=57493 RepID=UPI0006D81536|nr:MULTISPECIES: TetR family transcriptional regulator [Kocuria]RUP82332.1 TetR family transcriptional regulator [Kocuria sp. HSID17590]RUQ12548.1 TetR family transcriptional regulator [Kocuria sp. HSID17582]WNB88312.1 TetR family transcriptional regulator [Glutamicibacter protophormiae]
MTTKTEILDSALEVLRSGGTLTIDAVARAVGITKPGVVHHFPTKETLTVAVTEHLLDGWEEELAARAGDRTEPVDRLRAYVELTLLGEMDVADVALVADLRLREKLAALWSARMSSWFGELDAPALVAARLMADGAWIDRSLGLLDLDASRRSAVAGVALELIEKEVGR